MAGTYVLVGAEELHEKLATMQGKMANPHQFLAAVGELIVASVQRNFEESGRPEKWKALSAATLAAIARRHHAHRISKGLRKVGVGIDLVRDRKPGNKILIDSARLKNSIKWRVEGDSVKVGTNLIYAAIHQFGGPCGAGHKVMMPARPFLMVQDEDWEEIKAMGHKFFFGVNE